MTDERNGLRKEFVPTPLTTDQVDYAYELIDEIHPIEKYPIYEAFPYLKWVTSRCCYGLPYFKPVGEDGANAQVDEENGELLEGARGKTYTVNGKEYKKRSKKQKKSALSEKATKEEPLAQLGFGIVAYTGMLYYMIWAFGLFTLMCLPTFFFYAEGDAYANDANQEKLGYAPRTLGALGFSSYGCQSIPMEIGHVSLYCNYGQIGSVDYYGVNPEAGHGSCMENDNNSICAVTNPLFAVQLATIVGESSSDSVRISPADLWKDGVVPDPSCTDSHAYFYAQFTCIQSEQQQHEKYGQLCTIVLITCLIAYLFTIMLRHLYQGGKIQQLEWDMSTITAGDYTVEFPIGPNHYRHWYNNEYRKPGGDFEQNLAPALSLKKHMCEIIEAELTQDMQRSPLADSAANGPVVEEKKRKKADGHQPMTKVVVADIVFAFRNNALIEALRKRGGFIANQKFDKMREQDQVVNELFQDFDSLAVPTSAFITFEEEDGKILALKTTSERRLLGQPCKFTQASEPTDIIWENRHYSRWDYVKRQSVAFCIIALLLFGSFILVFITAQYSSKIANTYPQVDCVKIEEEYGTLETLQKYAVEDYNYIQQNAGKKSSGTLQCFCEKVCVPDNSECNKEDYGQADGDEICADYNSSIFINFLLTTSLTYVLTIVNFILRTVCIMLIDWIGYGTETERLSKTTTVTFLVQFFNTAFLLLLVGANLSEQPITFWLTSGQFSDFNSQWFRSIGNTLVGTMWINAWFPILEALGYFGLRIFFRLLDHGCSCDKYKTKTTSIQQYLNVYTGPEYLMHYKYSTLLNVVFVTFMYGLSMPILFPIACLSMVVLYFQEKLMLYYGYKVPPMYDERLSQNVLDRLQTAPIMLVLFGWWMASNQQLFSNNHLVPRPTTDDVAQSDHNMFSFFMAEGWQGYLWTMNLAFITLVFLRFGGNYVGKKIEDRFVSLKIGDLDIDENIDSYWASLDDEDRKWTEREDKNARSVLNMRLLTETQHSAMLNSRKTSGKTLQGVHSYDILANPLYLDDFQYVTAAEDDRNDMIIDDDSDEDNDAAQSDFVRVALNLAYLTDKEARQFRFDKRQMDELKQAGQARENNGPSPHQHLL